MTDQVYTAQVTAIRAGSLNAFNQRSYGCATIAALRALATPDGATTIDVKGYYAAGDGGGGTFRWDSASVVTDDSGLTIKPTATSGAGRWVRLTDGGMISVRWFGAKGDNVANDTAACQAAIDSLGIRGGTVYFPARGAAGVGQYKVSTLTGGEGVILAGDGGTSSQLQHSGSGDCIMLGGTASGLYHGCGVRDLYILLSSVTATGIRLKGTVNASVDDVYIEGPITAGRATFGVQIDGGNASSFFNTIKNVQCNHIQTGFRIYTSGSANATTTTFIDCSSLGDVGSVGAASIGLTIAANNGQGSVWIGGNFETCGIAVQALALANTVTFLGARFEANTTDISTAATAHGWSFIGCNALTTAKITEGNTLNSFIGCTDSAGDPIRNKLSATLQLRAKAVTDNPLFISGVLGQTAPVVLIENSVGALEVQIFDTGKITALGQIHGAQVVTGISTAGAGVWTAAGMAGGVINRTGPGAPYTDTTGTAADLVTAIPGAMVGTSFRLRVINTVAQALTLAAGTGVTLAGTVNVAASVWREYIGTFTNVTGGTEAVTLTGVGSGTL